jgi:hypothetical protein
MTYRVGQPVECINDRGAAGHLFRKQVYTCVAVEPRYLRVDCCARSDDPNHAWLKRRFRPIVDKKTDIGFAYEILRNASRVRESVE